MRPPLVIDNYDSFTYNLVQLLRECGCGEPVVRRNDKFEMNEVLAFEKILLSPGPGIPSEAGKMPELVREFAGKKSILGICLGHQCIAEVFGASLINLPQVVHGKGSVCKVLDAEEPLFQGLPEQFTVGRYHSWAASPEGFPDELKITADDGEACIMALRHKKFDLAGLQFHPESILTEHGHAMMKNWLAGEPS